MKASIADTVSAQARWARTWGAAGAVAFAILAVVVALFAVVPDRLVRYLERSGVSPSLRDAAATVWTGGAIALLAWGAVRVQRRGLI